MTARPPVKRLPFEPDGESGRNRGLMGGGQLGAARSTGNSLPLVRIRASEDLAIATANWLVCAMPSANVQQWEETCAPG